MPSDAVVILEAFAPRGPVAQFGSALPWHGRGREFESHQVHQNVSYTYRFPARQNVATGVQLESKPHFEHGQPWASRGFRHLPTIRPTDSRQWQVWAPWAP